MPENQISSHTMHTHQDSMTSALFDAYLFNQDAYVALSANRFTYPGLRVCTEHGIFQAAQTSLHNFISPGRAPFGGFDIKPGADFSAFVDEVEHALKTQGATTWNVVLPPLCYEGTPAVQNFITLCKKGYVVTRQEYNQSLPLDDRPFLQLGNQTNRKRFRRSIKLGLSTCQLSQDQYQEAYEILAENRQKKGRSLSMSWTDVEQLVTAFPERVQFFGAFLEERMIGSAICVSVGKNILYVYAWGERTGAETISPVTALAHIIHDYARTMRFSLLDLGTSSINGIINPGLTAFKNSLGAQATLKFWLTKTISAPDTAHKQKTITEPIDYSKIYDPETDFDHWYTILTAKRITPQLHPNQHILEIGCASGLLTQALVGDGRTITCIERSANYVTRARARALPGVDIHECRVEDFTSNRKFDHILAINVLHEIPDLTVTLEKLCSWLAPSGVLHITLPNPHSLHRLSAMGSGLIKTLDTPSDRGRDYGTLRLETAENIALLLHKFGLQEIRREAILMKPLPNAQMACLSDEFMEAYDALTHGFPQYGAMTYQVFKHV